MKMSGPVDPGRGAKGGIPNIFRVWREQGWAAPVIAEQLDPERILLTLSCEKIGDKKSAINAKKKEMIIAYLTGHTQAKASSIAEHIGLKPSRTRDYLNELIAEGVISVQGNNRNRTYRLKA